MARQSREDRGRRADAERNIAAIIDAGVRLLSSDPNASVADIAQAAGVGRVTLYGHFPSRETLVDRVLAHAVAQAEHALALEFTAELPAPEAVVALIEAVTTASSGPTCRCPGSSPRSSAFCTARPRRWRQVASTVAMRRACSPPRCCPCW